MINLIVGFILIFMSGLVMGLKLSVLTPNSNYSAQWYEIIFCLIMATYGFFLAYFAKIAKKIRTE